MNHELKPWLWATYAEQNEPVELVSYAIPNEGQPETIMIRTKVGDPTSLIEVLVSDLIETFPPDQHIWINREKLNYSDNPTAFIFKDELPVSVS